VYSGNDGLSFPTITNSSTNSISFQNLNSDSIYYYKVQAVNDSAISSTTEVLAASLSSHQHEVLIVHGFDRNSSGNELKNYIRQHAEAFKRQG